MDPRDCFVLGFFLGGLFGGLFVMMVLELEAMNDDEEG